MSVTFIFIFDANPANLKNKWSVCRVAGGYLPRFGAVFSR